jgi:hypothetical protein
MTTVAPAACSAADGAPPVHTKIGPMRDRVERAYQRESAGAGRRDEEQRHPRFTGCPRERHVRGGVPRNLGRREERHGPRERQGRNANGLVVKPFAHDRLRRRQAA